MNVLLPQLLAAAQLAEMAYNADPVDHKREAWEKAKAAHDEAAEAERLADQALGNIDQPGRPVVTDVATLVKDWPGYQELDRHNQLLAQSINALTNENAELHNGKLALAEENARLKEANTLLNSQLIEKGQQLEALEKSALSGKSTADAPAETSTPEGTPAATEQPMTAYQKGLQTKAANQAKAAEEAAKKNS